jgi:phosphatidylglycerophosphate synthase
MKLHYASDTSEWEARQPAKRNLWQKWANATHGVVTPGNVFSIVGIATVFVGLWAIADGQLWRGLWLLAGGRFCDVIDGTVANATGTKSPLGEAIDTTSDKVAAFATLFVFATSDIAPWPVMLIIGLQSLLIAGLGFTAYQLHKKPHTVAAGKVGGASLWVGLLSFAFAAALHNHSTAHHIWGISAYLFCGIGFSLCWIAIFAYARSLQRKAQPTR